MLTYKSKYKTSLILYTFIISTILLSQTVNSELHLPPKKLKNPNDLTYKLGTTGNQLVWQFQAEEALDFPGTYTVFRDGVELETHKNMNWDDKQDIVVNVDGLSIGIYVYRIEVTDHDSSDQPLLTATDEVNVEVVQELLVSNTETSKESDSNFPFISIFTVFFITLTMISLNKPRNS